jgi:hypothetical protein
MRSTSFNALMIAATFVFPGCTCSTTREVVKEPEPVVAAPAPAPTVVVAQPPAAAPPAQPTTTVITH